MRSLAALLSSVGLFGAAAHASAQKYWLLLQNDNQTWCGYTDMTDFRSESAKTMPSEVAVVTFSSGRMTEVTVQSEPESADWVVVDTYRPSNGDVRLRRVMRLVGPNLQIVREATIHAGKAENWREVSVTTLDGGRQAQLKRPSDTIELAEVSVETDLSRAPFMGVVSKMRASSARQLCKIGG